MSIQKKVVIEYLKGNIKDEKSLREFLRHEELKQRMEKVEKDVVSKVENIKPTDVSVLEAEIKGINEKIKEDTEIELIID